MSLALRQIVNARREIGVKVASELKYLEQSTHDNAIWTGRCLGALLEAHREAALPPEVGMEIVAMIAEMQMAAAQNCVRAGNAHARLREIALTYNIPLAGVPACPENEVFTGK